MGIIESAVLPLSRDGKSAEAQAAYLRQADPIHAEWKDVLRRMVELKRQNGDKDSTAAAVATQGRTIACLLMLVAFASGSVFVLLSVRSVNRVLGHAVTELSDGAEQVASAAGQVSNSSQ